VALVLSLAVGKREGDIAMVLTMAACVMTVMAAASALEPVIRFLYRLEMLGDWQEGMLGTLLKITGIGLVTETAGLICSDGGNSAMGRSLQLLGCGMMLRLSVPVMEEMLKLIQSILGEL